MRLANPPTGQHHFITRLEPGMVRVLYHAGKIDTRHMRVVPNQPTDAIQHHAVFIIERRVAHPDQDVALRQVGLSQGLEGRRYLAVSLTQHQGAEVTHD